MSFAFADLPWLTRAPGDFTTRRRTLAGMDAPAFWAETARLAATRLSATQAALLGASIAARLTTGGDTAQMEPLTLAVLSGATFDLLAEQLPAAAARHGVALRVILGGYDQVEQEALRADGVLAARPDATLLAVDHRWLRLDRPRLDEPAAAIDATLQRLQGVVEALGRNGGGVPILCTCPSPPETLFGSFDVVQPGAVSSNIAAFNAGLTEQAKAWGAVVLDVAALAARLGLDDWFDSVAWHGAKLPFAPAYAPAYAEILGRLLGALRGRSRKALVLDLDNTLWGGVLGDDGVEGLALGPDDAAGEAFAAVQDFALHLHQRGVFLAVCSKNDDATARSAFATRAGMRLTLDHIAVFQANWADKPANLAAIAQALNIGTDALVLLDDNPAERAQVRAAMPEVAVPELPADPSLYPRTLAAAGYFEAAAFSVEDATRTAGVRAQVQRVEMRRNVGNLGDYLADLKMVLTLAPFDAAGAPRIAQLANKTNQFNLNGRRFTEAEVLALAADPHAVTLQAKLEDRFGDLGMIAVVAAREQAEPTGAILDVEAWLMSCRVLGRGVEDALFAALLQAARARSVRWITARFIPTAKNAPVADLLPRLGFTSEGEAGDGRHRLSIADAKAVKTAIEVRSLPSARP